METIKRILAIALCLVVCLSLCGCAALDEMRRSHGVWADETKETILVDGVEYKLLPFNNTLKVETSYEYLYVTESDVPVLLSQAYGEYFRISEDRLFVANGGPYNNGHREYYCRADRYDETVENVNDLEIMDTYWYFYKNPDNYQDEAYKLTDEQVIAVADVLESEDVRTVPRDSGFEYDYAIDIYRCSDDLMFRRYICEIIYMDGEYVVATYTVENAYFHPVSEELVPVFVDLVSKFVEAEFGWENG